FLDVPAELNHSNLKDGASDTSLSSNASLPSVQSCQRQRERRVASWAVSFERLLQDPLGIRYFSDFLRKEFSEENILFWQACEYFNHIPAHDKNELSFRAQEIFNKYLCSKATTPVNIDSQVQLLGGKAKSGRSLNEESGEEDGEKKKKGTFFSWSRSRSLGRSQKKKENGNCLKESPQSGELSYRQKSQDSLSSAASLEMPLVLQQDSSILDSQTLRLEKRTLFRGEGEYLAVGANDDATLHFRKLRIHHHSYITNVNENGEQEPLDLGAPISSLDGQRVVLEEKISKKGKDKGKAASLKHTVPVTTNAGNQALATSAVAVLLPVLDVVTEFFELISKVQSNRADDQRGLLRKEDLVLPEFLQTPPGQTGLSTSVSRDTAGTPPQMPHPDGQEGRRCLKPPSNSAAGQRGPENGGMMPVALAHATSDGNAPRPPNLLLQGNPRWKEEDETMEEEEEEEEEDDVFLADLTLVPEGDIASPPSRRLPLSETGSPTEVKATSETLRPGLLHKPRTHLRGSEGSLYDPTSPSHHRDFNPAVIRKETCRPELPIRCVIDVDSVTASLPAPRWSCPEPESRVLFDGSVSEPRAGQPKRQTRTQRTSNLPAVPAAGSEENEGPCKATFV
ncbi:PREDICTED: regulator of G-protein signaling 12, partial [Thamnophis sirtalis]|uniref:Regulator of G-protein signaling 12 n=1 Tax=Thamnophis sirtalis TaxID=35019 RepID=A0A6I9YGR5_9SAUR